jgi:hypothetical protein
MAKKKKSCWCSVRRITSGSNKGSIGDMICATSKRAVRDLARQSVKHGLDVEMSRPRVIRAPQGNC